MSNMYGYTDYSGPEKVAWIADNPSSKIINRNDESSNDDSSTEENPLQVGFWMEGDSLAPPCGTPISTIHKILEFAKVKSSDVLYDLGCGDGRVCLEAYANYQCMTVGVEIEEDLVQRAEQLIARIPVAANPGSTTKPMVVKEDLESVLYRLVTTARAISGNTEEHVGETALACSDQNLPLPTLIVLYLLPEALAKIEPALFELLTLLPDGFRIVCNSWGLPNVYENVEQTEIEEAGIRTKLYLYTKLSAIKSPSLR